MRWTRFKVNIVQFFLFNFVCILDDFETFVDLLSNSTCDETHCALGIEAISWGLIICERRLSPRQDRVLLVTHLRASLAYFLILDPIIVVAFCSTVSRGWLHLLILLLFVRFIKVLKDVRFLIRLDISNVLLNFFNLANEKELVLLGQIVQVKLDFLFFRYDLLVRVWFWAGASIGSTIGWTRTLSAFKGGLIFTVAIALRVLLSMVVKADEISKVHTNVALRVLQFGLLVLLTWQVGDIRVDLGSLEHCLVEWCQEVLIRSLEFR